MFHSEVPNIFFLCAGKSVGKTSLTSFDNALLMAGVGNTNLMRVSSILPPNCKAIEPFALKQGILLPIAYATLTTDREDAVVSSSVAIAIPDDRTIAGVIMEYSDYAPQTIVEAKTRDMVAEGMEIRKIENYKVESKSVEAIVKENTTTFAGVVLWWDELR